MTIVLNPSTRWKVLGQFGSISTYFSKVNEGVYASGFQIPQTFWEDVEQKDFENHPYLLKSQARVAHIWLSQFTGVVTSGNQIIPKMDDKIVDNEAATWYPEEVTPMDWDGTTFQRYRLLCRLGT